MAITNNEKYKIYCTYSAKDVPPEHLKILVNLFVDYAAQNLGVTTDKANVDRLIEMIQEPGFNFLPVSVIASAFIRGSLGKLKNDNTKLSPRNIYEWLSEVSQEYKQKMEHDTREKELSVTGKTYDLTKYPLGRAIMWKIDKYNAGVLNDWDSVPLKSLAEMIGRGQYVTMKDFKQ